MLLARSVRCGFDDAPISASVLWLAGGAGFGSRVAMVPTAVACPRLGIEIARSGTVRLLPSTPIQVLGAWPVADTVSVSGFVSSLQPTAPTPPSPPPPPAASK